MKLLWLASAMGICLATAAAVAGETRDRPELELVRLQFAKSSHELSGLATVPAGLWGVADAGEDRFILKVVASKRGKRYELIPALDLAKLAGYDAVMTAQAGELRVPESDRRLDLEGLAVCGHEIYLINERVRQVLLVDAQAKTIAVAPVNWDAYGDLFKGESNAGFEGIAADCATRTLYVAKERDPRRLLVVDRATWKLRADGDFVGSDRAGQRVIHPFTGVGLLDIGADFADLTFAGGYLYALERNTYEVAKIDPATLTVVARVSYWAAERGLYATGEPFGLAEGLALTPDEIVIGLDHNHMPVSGTAAKRHDVRGEVGAILTFKRPSGF